MSIRTVPLGEKFFRRDDHTRTAWLGMAGVVVNVRGTILMIDPLLSVVEKDGRSLCEGEVPLKLPLPVRAEDLPRLDAVMYTHADGDHFGRMTFRTLARRFGCSFIAPPPVLEEIRTGGEAPERLHVARESETLHAGPARITITPAQHDWQETNPWRREDCCGYLISTTEGTIWHPGDTRLIDELYSVKGVDVFFFDVADVDSHLGPSGSAKLAASCGAKVLVPYHYGTFDLPPGGYATCDPEAARRHLKDAKARYLQLNPGEPLDLPV